MLASGAGSSVSVSLHPLVIMNISDHYTRVRVQGGDSAARGKGLRLALVPLTRRLYACSLVVVYGALLGRQKGRSVEVCNSFELVVSASGSSAVLDKEYFTAKEEQCEEEVPGYVEWWSRDLQCLQSNRYFRRWSLWVGTPMETRPLLLMPTFTSRCV